MEDNISRNISRSVTDLADKNYGINYFIIDSTASSPEGLVFYGGYAIWSSLRVWCIRWLRMLGCGIWNSRGITC